VSERASRETVKTVRLRRPRLTRSGKWQAEVWFAGRSRYVGIFDTIENATHAYDIARKKLSKYNDLWVDPCSQSMEDINAALKIAKKVASEGVKTMFESPRIPIRTVGKVAKKYGHL